MVMERLAISSRRISSILEKSAKSGKKSKEKVKSQYSDFLYASIILIEKPEQWCASSYQEYLNIHQWPERITSFEDILDIVPAEYREFVEERKDYQQELKKIKDMLFE
ncbi:MAG: hypothetical protein L6416_06490 [Candidatus Omnitrophica bacterium]|nr:hypothetical protein [Candidatus Omnitrophota bacterium]